MPKDKKTDIDSKLAVLQNRCLRIVASAFRATPVSILEVETHIAPMRIHLNQLQAQVRLRLRIESCAKYIADSCRIIVNKLRSRTDRRREHRDTPEELKHA